MKKILFAVMAMVAIGLASCGNKAQQADAAAADSLANDSIALLTQGTIDQINDLVEKKDAPQLAELLGTVHVQAAEYITMVQNFLKENAEKISAVVGENAAAKAAVEAITSVTPEAIINSVLDQMKAEEIVEEADAAQQAQ